MTLFWDNQHPNKTCDKAIVERVLEACLTLHGAYHSAEVGVTLVDDGEIQALNREHRGIDRATDVLSFPLLDYEEDYERDGEAEDEGQPMGGGQVDGAEGAADIQTDGTASANQPAGGDRAADDGSPAGDGLPFASKPSDGEALGQAWDGPDPDVDPQTGEILLGDIVISLDTAERQAGAYGHSFEREVGFLACHGMLHLLGYDHMTPRDEALMLDMQRQVMDTVGLERDGYGLATSD